MSTLKSILETAEFEICSTGGGFQAYHRDIFYKSGQHGYAMITSAKKECAVPTSKKEQVVLGVYSDADDTAPVYLIEGTTEEALMKFNAYLLAVDFTRGLNEYLTEEQMAEVIKRNETAEYQDGSCATHDFCDANVMMLEAFENVLGREFVFADEDDPHSEAQNTIDTMLWSAAWEIARNHKFKF
jgi:hypothetical protein